MRATESVEGTANITAIRDRLVQSGRQLLEAKQRAFAPTNDPATDALLNDLDGTPHAFVIACVMDRQIRAEKAWSIPYRLSQRIGDFAFSTLHRLSPAEIARHMREPEPLHRYPDVMAKNLRAAVQRIDSAYGGDASRIWKGRPSSAEVVFRFLEFEGIGPKIATMATNILARDFKVPFSDHYSIDVSADVHVRRVFERLGLVRNGAPIEEIIYRGRALYPEFPGLLDLPVWNIGHEWSRPTRPLCPECEMRDLCPTATLSG